MRILLAHLFLFISFFAPGQQLWRKIRISFNGEIGGGSFLSDKYKVKVSTSITQALGLLSEHYRFDFVDPSNANDIDIMLKVSLGFNDLTTPSVSGSFMYKSNEYFYAIKSDTVMASAFTLFKNIETSTIQDLSKSYFNSYSKIFSKIILPVDSVSVPSRKKDKAGNCICLTIPKYFKNFEDSEKLLAISFTHIINNAIIFQQESNSFEYYDLYKNSTTHLPKNCEVVSGEIKKEKDTITLTIKYGSNLKLRSPKVVMTTFIFTEDEIKNHFYKVVRLLNKSVFIWLRIVYYFKTSNLP